MNKSKLSIGISLMMLAVVGAFASASKTNFVSVYAYNSSQECVLTTTPTVCDFINIEDCVKTTALGAPARQIYSDISSVVNPQTGKFDCLDPYSQTQP